MDSVTKNLRSYHDDFHSTGSYVASGFVNGIKDNISSAAKQAAAMAKAASDAAKKELGVASPSRVFAWIGQMVSQGFTNSMNDSVDKVFRSGSMMAQSAVNGFNSVDLSFGTDLDPTIRPVMDLSTIKRQTSQMSSMIDGGIDPIRAKVDYIGRLERQNGADYQTEMFNRLVSATNENAKELSDLRGDLSRYNDSIAGQETAVYVDGKKLASTIAKPMNQQLGIRSRRGSLSRV